MTAEPIEIEKARALALAGAEPLEIERLPLGAALDRVLAEEAAAADPVPGFDNSAMDGFAVRAADTRGARADAPVELPVAGEARAGRPSDRPLRAGEAVAISTGAMLPAGADAVVRIEDTRVEGERVLVAAEVEAGRDVRRAGEDVRPGERVLPAGTRLGPAELGVLASLGQAEVACRRRPRVRILTGGDELVEPGEPMRPGGVRNSNAYSLAALAERAGAEVVSTSSVGDDPEATREAVADVLEADVAVICGGVSVGRHDHVKGALAALGAEQVFWGVALKPGRPTWFGRRDGALAFGLPGNPVSAMVAFTLFARPVLAALSGRDPAAVRTTARLGEDYEKPPGRAHALRCRLELDEGGWRAWPAPFQGSHVLTSMLGADCLAIVPAGTEAVRAGEPVEVELLGRD